MEERDLEEKAMAGKQEAKDMEEKAKEEASNLGAKEAERAKEDCMRLTYGGADKVKGTMMDLVNGVGGRSHNHGGIKVCARLDV